MYKFVALMTCARRENIFQLAALMFKSFKLSPDPKHMYNDESIVILLLCGTTSSPRRTNCFVCSFGL